MDTMQTDERTETTDAGSISSSLSYEDIVFPGLNSLKGKVSWALVPTVKI